MNFAKLLCPIVAAASLLTAAWLGYELHSDRVERAETLKEEARQETRTAARQVSKGLQAAERRAARLAGDLDAGGITGAALRSRLRRLFDAMPGLHGVAVVYAAEAGKQAATPYLVREGGSFREYNLADFGDFTAEPWYSEAIRGNAGWREPAIEQPGDILTVKYSLPIHRPGSNGKGPPAGVLVLTGTFSDIERSFRVFESHGAGWGVLISKRGYFLVHPDPKVVKQRADVRQFLEARNDPKLTAAIERMLAGEAVFQETTSDLTGQAAWFFTEPIPENGWSVVVVRIVDELMPLDAKFRRAIIRITVAAVVGLLALLIWGAIVVYTRSTKETGLWVLVALATLCFAAGVGTIRRVTVNQDNDEAFESFKVLDQTTLASFLRSQEKPGTELVTLPTGVFLQSVKFVAPRETLMTGYIWQKFPGPDAPAEPQFVLPDAYEPQITEAYRRPEEGGVVVGWRFESTLRQRLELSLYPFDHDNLSVRLWPLDFRGNVELVPDLPAYSYINPSALPGTKKDMEIPGWWLSASFFDYQFREYDTDFGLKGLRAEEAVPQLRFNVTIKRHLLDPVIQNFVPLLVILIMLFAVLVTTTSDIEESKLLGFNPSGTMRITSALFFVTLVAHIQLRNTLETHEIVFLEYSYFTVYLALLGTALHRFLFLMGHVKLAFVEHRDSLALKLLFWPVIGAIQFIVAVVLFY